MFVAPSHWIARPSPNHSARVKPVTAIILHADASRSEAGTLSWITSKESGVSYHVVIGRDGRVYSVVNPDRVAWHAGVSELNGVAYCNSYSVGVCLSNTNDGKEPYPINQFMMASRVCAVLCAHYGIAFDRIVSHAHVARPAGRKTDPKGFDVMEFQKLTALAGVS